MNNKVRDSRTRLPAPSAILKGPAAEKPPAVSPRAYMEFATFASKFTRAKKPVRFEGTSWRL